MFDPIAWHPDGEMAALASTGLEKAIYLWDTVHNRLAMAPLEGPKNDGIRGCFNYRGDRLLTADWSNYWRLWDTQTGQQLLSLPAAGNYVQFSPDDSLVGAEVSAARIRLFRFHP